LLEQRLANRRKRVLGRLIGSATLAVVLSIAVPGYGGVIKASNAGPLPSSAQDLTGLFPSEIDGTLLFPNGVSMFKLLIYYPLNFSADTTQISFGVPDTELFLFDANGLGVYANDDISASNTLSCLPSGGAGNPCLSARGAAGPVTSGVYYLAITRSANSPLSVGGNIFTFLASTAVAGPDLTQGGGHPITGWDNGVNTGPDFDLTQYKIVLSGATPEPVSWLLTASGLVLVFVRRRVGR
jgi:hypothetical protein